MRTSKDILLRHQQKESRKEVQRNSKIPRKQFFFHLITMRRNCASAIKLAILFGVTILITFVFFRTLNNLLPAESSDYSERREEHHPRTGAFFGGAQKNVNAKRIDWQDYAYQAREAARAGLGEMGRAETLAVELNDEKERMYRKNGFNALLSDKISVNRSIPDIRHPKCKDKRYLSELPTVSVVVPVFNEHWSTLLRTVYSVLNRSPAELMKEIILVDDFSDRDSLKEPLDTYVAQHLPKVKVIHLEERTGLIGARLAGAKIATGDVLLFLDSHCEATVNWLPPLLEPIAMNYKVCMCPFIDVIAHDTFQYRAQDEGARGAFDWQFYYKRLPVTKKDEENMPEPFASPVMAGGLFAISAKFFWELGGYDPGLDIWGGEQYELSFKIWQCGGEMYDAPCSRVGHIYRGPMDHNPNPRKVDFISKNYKRVAEVWMDEYKEFLYERQPHVYNDNLDAGDLTEQKAVRERLQCKPFKWFMENIAFDLIKKYPPRDPPDFASGAIQSVAHPTLCIDQMGQDQGGAMGVYPCASNLQHPQMSQFWVLSYRKDLRIKNSEKCLDISDHKENAPVLLWSCHAQGGNQYFRYHPDSKLLKHGHNNRCLEVKPDHRKLVVNKCDEDNPNMQWEFGFVNQTAIDLWDKL